MIIRNTRRKLLAVLTVSLLLCAAAVPSSAQITTGFEEGLGQNAQAIGTSIPGLIFTTILGYDVHFADINSDWYSVTSDNGKIYGDGEYFVSEDVAAYVTELQDVAKISFVYSPASYFTIGYSSQFQFVLEAYDSMDNLLDSSTGSANVKSQGGTGLLNLTVSHTGSEIAYVTVGSVGAGGYWMMDNINTDALIPEPAGLLALAVGLVGMAGFATRRRR